MSRLRTAGFALLVLLASTLAFAQASSESGPAPEDEVKTDLDYAQVLHVVATETSEGTWRFDVTVEHNDEGWDHYADLWHVVHPETLEVYGERELLHPHDNEQPFTRSESGMRIPDGRTTVLVRAKCNVHGFGGRTVLVDLTVDEGERFEVRR
ncbi:MAG: hypothetical protein ACOCVO_00965 [bacterium]